MVWSKIDTFAAGSFHTEKSQVRSDGRLSLMPYHGASSSITKGHIINKLVLLLVALTKQRSLISSELKKKGFDLQKHKLQSDL